MLNQISISKYKFATLIIITVISFLSNKNFEFTEGPVVCAFRTFTGHPCPACGSIRSIGALVQGDLISAWQFNPLTLLGVITFVSYIFFPKSVITLGAKIDQFLRIRRRFELNPILLLSIAFVLLWIFNLQRWS